MIRPELAEKLITLAVEEDIFTGDFSSLSSVPSHKTGTATLLAKQEGILAGVEAAKIVFKKIDNLLQLEVFIPDGSKIFPGDEVFKVTGSAQSLLKAERLMLNIVQRMSGIATLTNQYVKAVEGTSAKILDTRKTTPGFRFFEKWAVTIGGGYNHRFGLYDMIMLKDNHIDFAGGITQAVEKARAYLIKNNLNLKIEVETRNLQEVKQALNTGYANRIMLDNFTISDTKKAVKLIGNQAETESSGGITLKTIKSYANCGVNFISVGALTHQINSLDLSFKAKF